MTILRIKLDTRSNTAKALLNYLLSLSKDDKTIQIEWEGKADTFNKETQKAIAEAKKGNITKYKNSEDLFNKLGI